MTVDDAIINFDNNTNTYWFHGSWTIMRIQDAITNLKTQSQPNKQELILDGSNISNLDSAGALTILDLQKMLITAGNTVKISGFNKQQLDILHLISTKDKNIQFQPQEDKKQKLLYKIGEEASYKLSQADGFLTLIGDLVDKLLSAFASWHRFQIPSIISNMASTGLYALPIIGLLSFLIGVVLAYQMGLQLENYGATSFIAYLSGMAIFREFAPLITAIIVAGRTSSAFTAQIGSMKINEEIDALYTMGLSPTELLVVPKVLGLMIMMPLLIFWADVFSVLGAMIMSKFKLHVGYYDYLVRLQNDVGCKQLMLGMYKAPTFAILISLVGCFQGFQVQANADSVGSQTTRSVVQALFLIIITDAVYSIIYSWLRL